MTYTDERIKSRCSILCRVFVHGNIQACAPGPAGEQEAHAKVGSAGLQAREATSGKAGSRRTCDTMRLVSACHALTPLPAVPTSITWGAHARQPVKPYREGGGVGEGRVQAHVGHHALGVRVPRLDALAGRAHQHHLGHTQQQTPEP